MTKPGTRLVATIAAAGILSTFAFTGWTARGVVQVRERLARIEANRFTSTNSLELWQRLAEVESMARNDDPPAWFVTRLDKLESKLDDVAALVVTHVARHASQSQPNPPGGQ